MSSSKLSFTFCLELKFWCRLRVFCTNTKAFIINYLSITSISLSDHHNRIERGYDNSKNKINIEI